MPPPDGIVALVTGAARGIGYGIAQSLATEGFHIAVNDIVSEGSLTDQLTRLESHGIRTVYCRADVTDTADRRHLVATVEESLGPIDILVNNAGVAPETRTDILQATEASFERVLGINLKGPYFLTQAVANRMLARRIAGHDGLMCIVNIASSNSVAASPDRGEYCVSKAGVSMATKLWAVRLGEHNIPVYEIRPGIIATGMTAPVKEKYDRLIAEGLLLQKRWGQPEDVGRAVAMLCRGDLPYATGQVIHVDGGQLIPRL